MSYIYEKGRIDELDAIVEEACKVFGVDFPTLLPKIYAKGCESGPYHHLIKEEDGIKALVLSYPDKLRVLDRTLKVYGIGTVSVDGERRGRGYMIELMNACLDEMREQGCDFSVLGGQKQRYGYFGYSSTVDELHFSIHKTNMRHIFGADYAERAGSYSFGELERGSADEKFCAELIRRSPVWCERRAEDFKLISETWEDRSTVIYRNGEPCGYFVSNRDRTGINELELADFGDIMEVVRSIFAELSVDHLSITLPTYRAEAARPLYSLAEHFSTSPAMNLNVINYKTTLEAFARLKGSYAAIPEGAFTLGVQRGDKLEKYRIEMSGDISVTDVTETAAEPELSLPHLRMQEFLFSSAAGAYLGPLSAFAKALFPLPFFFANADKV